MARLLEVKIGYDPVDGLVDSPIALVSNGEYFTIVKYTPELLCKAIEAIEKLT